LRKLLPIAAFVAGILAGWWGTFLLPAIAGKALSRARVAIVNGTGVPLEDVMLVSSHGRDAAGEIAPGGRRLLSPKIPDSSAFSL
jgi:hypothetical protein